MMRSRRIRTWAMRIVGVALVCWLAGEVCAAKVDGETVDLAAPPRESLEALREPVSRDAQRQSVDTEDLEAKLAIWNVGMEPWHPELVNPEHTGPALTIQLSPDEAIVVPPHLADQRILSVYDPYYLSGLNDCVLVGLNAYTAERGIPQAYVLVYEKRGEGWGLRAELPLREHFMRMETLELDEQQVLVIYGASGMHFTDLWVYTFEAGKPRLLFQTGSAAGVSVRPATGQAPATVWVGIEDWADPTWSYASGARLWNVYAWNGSEFAFSEALSTTHETSVAERTEGAIIRVREALE